jgi:CelD/BcsL family acetyltransferase involved in cellulose biosynthesis
MSRTHAHPGQYALFDELAPLRREGAAEDLPATALELIEVIGLQATIDLVAAFAGDDVKIPSKVDGKSRIWAALAEAVGHEAAAKLVARYQDTTLYVPTCAKALRKARDIDIVRSLDAGEPFDSVRRRHKLTRRHLYRIAKLPL